MKKYCFCLCKTLACVNVLLGFGLLPFISAEPMDTPSSEESLMCDASWDAVLQSRQQIRDALDLIEDAIQHCGGPSTLPCLPIHEPAELTARDCADLYHAGHNKSGVYNVYVFFAGYPLPVSVYCDMETDGGGWLVFQRRQDGSVDFNRNWTEYSFGFGNISGEFWLGNDLLHLFSGYEPQQLRVDLRNHSGSSVYAKYGHFYVGSQKSAYILNVGNYSGNAGDSLDYHDRGKFSTKDRDNGGSSTTNCASFYKAGWWFKDCFHSNLNGLYRGTSLRAIRLDDWHCFGCTLNITSTEMKMRPLSF